MKYIVGAEDDGIIVKAFLGYRLGLSRAFIKHLKFLENGILLGGKRVTVRAILHTGDELELATEDSDTPEHLTPSDIPLDVIYEDDCIILPNKPPFMPTHPSHLHHGDTLADALAYRYLSSGEPFVFRPVNRLDRNTSGITLIAKDRVSAARLSEAMRNGEIKKKYLAILDGELPQDEGIIETYMKRTEQSIIVRRVCNADEGGDYALTYYTCLCKKDGMSLVEAYPKTGRTHQLRVHFASLGCPILSDELYGKEDGRIARHALHAASLTLPHPKSGKPVTFSAPMPRDMRELCFSLFGYEQK